MNDLSPEQEAYLMSERFKQAEKEKNDFTTHQFLQCLTSFDKFKKGEHYWLEYIGGDMYVGRSDNVLGEKFHITPCQLYTIFKEQESINNQFTPEQASILDKHIDKILEQKPIEKVEPNSDFELCLKHIMEEAIECGDTHNLKADAELLYNIAQKSAEWSEEDAVMLDSAIAFVKHSAFTTIGKGKNNVIAWLKSLRPQPHWKPAEWSEDDEERYLSCLKRLSTGDIRQPETINTAWLKSLKDRVQSKSKQEWSEEDEKIYNRVYDLIHAAAYANYDVDEDGKELGEYAKIINWFKSLKPQKQWKPSEEQMNALDSTLQYSQVSHNSYEHLNSLYNDLKQL